MLESTIAAQEPSQSINLILSNSNLKEPVTLKINNKLCTFGIDSGESYSIMSPASFNHV